MDEKAFYRLKILVGGSAVYASQNDEMRVLERACRRADLPLAYTQGFNPRPLFSFGPARPTGFGSTDDIAEIAVKEEIEPAELKKELNQCLPEGFFVMSVLRINPEEFGKINAKVINAVTGVLVSNQFSLDEILRALNEAAKGYATFYFDSEEEGQFFMKFSEAITNGKIMETKEGRLLLADPGNFSRSAFRLDKLFLDRETSSPFADIIRGIYILRYELEG